jgi:glycosidase
MSSKELFIKETGRYSNPVYELHVAKQIRKKYGLEDFLFTLNGNIIFANFAQVRNFVYKFNQDRPDNAKVGAGEINAAGLLDEIFHFVLKEYQEKVNPGVFDRALTELNDKIGEEPLRKLLFEFIELFPPIDVYKGQMSAFDYLNSFTGSRSNISISLEELITLYLANFNPANIKIIELFSSKYFSSQKLFDEVINGLDLFFQKEAKIGEEKDDVFTFLMMPILKHPDSVEAQLDYIKDKWKILLNEQYLKRILKGKDLIKEEYKIDFSAGGPPPAFVPQYKEAVHSAEMGALGKSGYKYEIESSKVYAEPEKFTADLDWMPSLVLMAKNVYVWLDQLSKKYMRSIRRLDEIPDEELDILAKWNYTGLWLIGIWERSSASKKIKHFTGNIDAVASAYSLYDYQIAYDLGGEDAYRNLDWRAKQRGIRLACDMVPNHTGIYSKWVVEHPEYFIQSDYPPFPNYKFEGPDLSDDHRIQLRIEDGYWQKNDAAVVFQRIDNGTGKVSYIYHGNDGTNMPWNDTAQLNLLKKEVREAVIEKIMDVARKFSVIRFDAAMTLTKKHFSRLWYPEPGRGGDIPSRTDYSLTKEEFDNFFPEEFWREVVDRMTTELPNTLLLAEAFWLMEGYFVRSLGMHRVYNSAFMHMLLKEENSKYRDLITNTLEFEPEILKRYVNFMSNPDEETAIKQFGAGEKYFGICVLMVTLPGLPMFGHGQIEGYAEKYGMEYQRSYYNEEPNKGLIEKHEKEIFPLIKRRFLFSQVQNFWFYDFIADQKHIDENIFAYTNTEYGQRALVFYNNKYSAVKGKINISSPKLVQANGGKEMKQLHLWEALHLNTNENVYYIFKEHKSDLQYIRSGADFKKKGFSVHLGEFEYKVYLDFTEVTDKGGECKRLAEKLKDSGTINVLYALEEIHYEKFHAAFENLFSREVLNSFINYSIELENPERDLDLSFLNGKLLELITCLGRHFEFEIASEKLIDVFEKELGVVKSINELMNLRISKKDPKYFSIKKAVVFSQHNDYHENTAVFIIWYIINNLNAVSSSKLSVRQFIDDTYLYNPVRNVLRSFGKGELAVEKDLNLILILAENYKKFSLITEDKEIKKSFNKFYIDLFDNPLVKTYLNINKYQETTYFGKESFDELADWFFSIVTFELLKLKPSEESFEKTEIKILEMFKLSEEIKSDAVKCGFKLDIFTDLLKNL